MRLALAIVAGALLSGCATGGREAPVEWRGGAGAGQETWLSQWSLQPEPAPPAGAAHIVEAGETLWDIAGARQVPLRALIDANGLSAPFTITPGQRLIVPPPATHTVRPGDTLAQVAERYRVHARSLALLNRRDPDAPLRVGEALILPFTARAAPAAAGPSPPVRSGAAPPRQPARPPPARGDMIWPVEGQIVGRFGAQPGKKRSDGIDLQASPGAIVRAAAPGVVVYAGDDLPGYGNLVLVQHGGGFITAYARLGRADVKVGISVRGGDAVGVAGAEPVHFQVRSGGAPLDPESALPAAKA